MPLQHNCTKRKVPHHKPRLILFVCYFWVMRIKKIHIQNYKSLVDFELDSPPPFCAFVGPNASGKSNIFEALEFTNYLAVIGFGAFRYDNYRLSDIISFKFQPDPFFKQGRDPSIKIHYKFEDELQLEIDIVTNKNILSNEIEIDSVGSEVKPYRLLSILDVLNLEKRKDYLKRWEDRGKHYHKDYEQFIDNFSRIFVGKKHNNSLPEAQNKLSFDASNLSQVIGQVFQNENKREDFIEWLQILIPEFKNIEVKQNSLDGKYEFFIYEKHSNQPFPKHLISDGTYNILALMAAIYQSDEPQFLCIEEPENGLHPQAIKLLVEFLRDKCTDEGHHIWLNTHSQTLVRCMEINEIVMVNKINGATRAKMASHLQGIKIKTDEAWLSNALGGGVSWSM